MNLDQFEEKVNKKATKISHDLKYEVGTLVLFERIQAGLSQEELAKKIKTKQPGIARVESGRILPSLTFLEKIANALGMCIKVTFIKNPREEIKTIDNRLKAKNTSIGIPSQYYKWPSVTTTVSS